MTKQIDTLVSVCIQTYNHEKYIQQCLDGVIAQQTNFPFEIIIGEDESNDKTRSICSEFASKHPEKVQLFLRSRKDVIRINGTPTGRYNFTQNLLATRGTYIALCEGDDYWTDPLKLQKQVDFLESNPEFAICFHRANTLLDNGTLELHAIPDLSKEMEYEYSDLLEYYNFITTASSMFKKPASFHIPEWLCKVPFGDLGIYKIATEHGRMKCLDDTMSVYRIHAQGAYSKLTSLKKVEQYLDFYKIIYPYLSAKEKQVVKKKRTSFIDKLIDFKHSKSKYPKFLLQLYYTYLK